MSAGRIFRIAIVYPVLCIYLSLLRFGPFFVEPIVAGLDPVTKESFICSMDLIGCKTLPNDFVVAGTAEEQLLGKKTYFSSNVQHGFNIFMISQGMCEALWFEDMGPDQLFESISQALTNAVDRDASAGWGGVVHIIEPHQVEL